MNDIIVPGQLIGDDYLLIEELGRGGYASVWKAHHQLLDIDVALKVINVKSLDAANVKRVEQECKLAGQLLNLPGIVRVQIPWRKDPYLFIAMELMFCDLETWINKQRVPFAQALQWALDLCDTLKQVHAHKEYEIIHRDITPRNILLDSQGVIKLGDFGIAHIKGSLSSPAHQPGTIDYKAPELNRGGAPTPAADVYSLCAVLFKLWSYSLYYDYSRMPVASQRNEFLKLLKKYHKDIPDTSRVRLADTILGGLNSNEKERFSLARIQNDLQMIQASLGDQKVRRVRSRVPIAQAFLTEKTLYSPAPLPLSPTEPVFYLPSGKEELPPTERIGPPPPFESYRGHRFEVTTLAWSPDDLYVASADTDGKVHVWNASTRARLSVYPTSYGRAKEAIALAWSPDSQRIALVNKDSEVWMWDALTGENASQCPGISHPVRAIVWLRDGLYIASGFKDVQVFQATTRKRLVTYNQHTGMIKAVAWSPNGQRIASIGSDGKTHIWEISNGKSLFVCDSNSYNVVWSRDGHFLALLCADSQTQVYSVQVWNVTTRSHIVTFHNHSLAVKTISWSPDGRRIASAGDDGTVQVWNAVNGEDIFVYLHHAEKVADVTWSHDGQHIASASKDRNGRSVHIWNAPAQTNFLTCNDHAGRVTTTVSWWSPSNEFCIASACEDGIVRVMNPFRSHSAVKQYKPLTSVTVLSWPTNYATIAIGGKDGSIHMWDTSQSTRHQVLRLQKHTRKVDALAWSSDRKRIASASEGDSVLMWETLSGKTLAKYSCNFDKLTALFWLHERVQCLSINDRGVVRVWVAGKNGWENIYQVSCRGVTNATCSTNGKYIACATHRTINIYELARGANKHPISTYTGHSSTLLAMSWSPDGRYIVSASEGSVNVWDILTGQKLAFHPLHTGRINSVDWSSDSKYILSTGDDGIIRVWAWQIE